MPNREAYLKYLKSAGLEESQVSRIFDPKEANSILAIAPALLASPEQNSELSKFVAEALNYMDKTTNDLLNEIHQKIRSDYHISDPAFLGVYPTPIFDGEAVEVDGGSIILVNEGAIQLIGAFVQLVYSRQSASRKAAALRAITIEYIEKLTVPENSVFMGSWADFKIQDYITVSQYGTAAESFLILHEYGHIVLKLTDHTEETELKADLWALRKISSKDIGYRDFSILGPFLFLGLCLLIETIGSRNGRIAVAARTHPGAALRLAQAAVEIGPLLDAATLRTAYNFLELIDATIVAEAGSSSGAIAKKTVEVTLSINNLLPINFYNLSDNGERLVVLEALLRTANRVVDDDNPASADANSQSELPAGITRTSSDGVYLYELPSGEKMEMILVDKGPFLFGPKVDPGYPSVDDLALDKESSLCVISQDYFIGRYPVTIAQYTSFCKARGREPPPPPDWNWSPGSPVVNISVQDAEAFCHWSGLTLPSEQQWEKAARGSDGRRWPWGNAPLQDGEVDREKMPLDANPKPQTASPSGAQHMLGNIWEITSDWLESPTPMSAGQYRVVRGGSYRANKNALTILSRHRVMSNFRRPEIGLRAVLELVEQDPGREESWIDDVLASNTRKSDEITPKIVQPDTTGSIEAARQLFEACASIDQEGVAVVKAVLAIYPQAVHWRNDKGFTPLLLVASHLPYFEAPFRMASTLIEAGADVDAQTPDGSTALHMLAVRPQMYSLELAELLLNRGANIDLKDGRGFTVTMNAQRFAPMMGNGFLALIAVHRR